MCEVDVRNGGPKVNEVCLNHLLTDTSRFGGTIGIAWVGTICSNYVSVSATTGYYQQNHGMATYLGAVDTARVSAHEIGHNFGQWCWRMIAACGDTCQLWCGLSCRRATRLIKQYLVLSEWQSIHHGARHLVRQQRSTVLVVLQNLDAVDH
jgi:hypothetical protein